MASAQARPAAPTQSDLELARRAACGEEAAFVAIMRRHNRMLYRVARGVLKNDTEAEDALQDAYLLAYRRMGSFLGEAQLSTWLVRIVINEALARLRKRRRESVVIPLLPEGSDVYDSAGPAEDAMRPETPDQAALRAETRRLLERKIDALPDGFRVVFILRALEELSVEETALALGIPEATVRSRFFRARALLRESLSKEIDIAVEDAFAFAGERCDRIVARVLARLHAGEAPPG